MKIYLSAAAHAVDNRTACPVACSENTHANAYMDRLEARLRALGCEVKRGDPALTGEAAMRTRVREANAWGADLYYVAHTNAGGGRYSMTMCWSDAASRQKAEILHRHRTCVASHKVATNRSLYEIKMTAMTCLYDELFFHDNAVDCAWFHDEGMAALAEETAAAICEMGGVAYTPPATDPVLSASPSGGGGSPSGETATDPLLSASPSGGGGSASAETERAPITPRAGDRVTLNKGRLYLTARGSAYVTRTGTFYLYDGVRVGGRYRVTNRPDRVGKTPLAANVSGWVTA